MQGIPVRCPFHQMENSPSKATQSQQCGCCCCSSGWSRYSLNGKQKSVSNETSGARDVFFVSHCRFSGLPVSPLFVDFKRWQASCNVKVLGHGDLSMYALLLDVLCWVLAASLPWTRTISKDLCFVFKRIQRRKNSWSGQHTLSATNSLEKHWELNSPLLTPHNFPWSQQIPANQVLAGFGQFKEGAPSRGVGFVFTSRNQTTFSGWHKRKTLLAVSPYHFYDTVIQWYGGPGPSDKSINLKFLKPN